MDQAHRPRQFYLVGLDQDDLALDAAQVVLPVARKNSAAVDHDAIDIILCRIAVEFEHAAGGGEARVQFRQHAARFDMAFVGIEQASAETALERGFEFIQRARVEPPMPGREPGKTFEVGAVARMRHHQRAVERGLRKMLAPKPERADAEPADEGLRGLGLAPGREHAAGPVAGRLRHPLVTALMQRDRVAGLRKQQRLPRPRNTCADHGNGGVPPRR